MALTKIGGGIWTPLITSQALGGMTNPVQGADITVDADEEEVQFFGYVRLEAGTGSKTFGTSGSSIGWMSGASITFNVNSQLRVGVKKASSIDAANGPTIRATIGGAAFDVYNELVGGTDTISNTAWREDAMDVGTPFTVNHGDLLCVSFWLNSTAGSPSVKVRAQTTLAGATNNMPVVTLVTSGPTYTAQTAIPNIILTFDDSTHGTLDGSVVFSTAPANETIGNTNLFGNVFRPIANIGVDAVAAVITEAGTTNFDIGIMSTPFGTPAYMSNGSVSLDPQQFGSNGARTYIATLPAELSLTAGSDYAMAVKQNSATGIVVPYWDVNDTAHHQFQGLDANCYCVKSTAGAAFSSQNSGKRRAAMWVRISSLDVASGSSIYQLGM